MLHLHFLQCILCHLHLHQHQHKHIHLTITYIYNRVRILGAKYCPKPHSYAQLWKSVVERLFTGS